MATWFRCSITVVVALVFASAVPAAAVFVVDVNGGPGVDSTQIDSAIAAALPGDIVLVRPGLYSSCAVDGKGISVIADPVNGIRPTISSVLIRNIPIQQRALVRGFDVTLTVPLSGSIPLEVSDNRGPVVIEDLKTKTLFPTSALPPGALVDDCDRVVFIRCELLGTNVPTNGLQAVPGSTGMVVIDSNVALYECLVVGGNGVTGGYPPSFTLFSSAGGIGIHVTEGDVLVAGSVVRGGAGGNGVAPTGFPCIPAASGGDGIRLSGPKSYSVRIDSTVTGGTVGVEHPSCPSSASNGIDVKVLAGSAGTINELLRSCSIASPTRMGQSTMLELSGVPGELCAILFSLNSHGVYQANLSGTLVPRLPLQIAILGALPGSGTLGMSVPLPAAMPPGVGGFDVYLQVIVAGQSGNGVLGSPTALTVLDAAF